MKKLVSVDLYARFGFLKKPDINDGIYLTYNMLHKPAIQGILGAILGLEGYSVEGEMDQKDIPEYRRELADVGISVLPLNSINGNFKKDVIRYTNTVGYASKEEGNVLIINEQTLINPAYRLFIYLEDEQELQHELFKKLKNQEAEYIPYLGKNDHQMWWENFLEWKIFNPDFKAKRDFKIDSIFQKPVEDEKLLHPQRTVSLGDETVKFAYYERLPSGWHKELPHYTLGEFLYTNYLLQKESNISRLMKIFNEKYGELIIQVF